MAEEIKKDGGDSTGSQAPEKKEQNTGADNGAVDYKALLEKAQTELAQAQHKIVELKKDKKENPQADTTIDVESITASVTEVVKKDFEKLTQDLVRDSIQTEVEAMTQDPAQRELIKLTYDNKIVKSGFDRLSIRKDLQSAKLLADQPVFEKKMKEMEAAAISAKTTNGGSATGQDVPDKGGDNLSKDELSMVDAAVKRGFKREDVVKQLLLNRAK